jgi:hypothetical protein
VNICHNARFHIPEVRNLHWHQREDPKPHILSLASQLNGATPDRSARLRKLREKSREEWNNVTLISGQETLYDSYENETVFM